MFKITLYVLGVITGRSPVVKMDSQAHLLPNGKVFSSVERKYNTGPILHSEQEKQNSFPRLFLLRVWNYRYTCNRKEGTHLQNDSLFSPHKNFLIISEHDTMQKLFRFPFNTMQWRLVWLPWYRAHYIMSQSRLRVL